MGEGGGEHVFGGAADAFAGFNQSGVTPTYKARASRQNLVTCCKGCFCVGGEGRLVSHSD